MAKSTWIALPEAYKEYYGMPVSDNKRTASVQLSKFKKLIIDEVLPFAITTLHNKAIQVRKEDIQAYKDKHASIEQDKKAA